MMCHTKGKNVVTLKTPYIDDKEDTIRLGNTIKFLRILKGLTQSELANASGINKSTLCLIEKGQRKVQLHYLIGIATALDLKRSEIVELSDRVSISSPQDLFHYVKDELIHK